MKKIMIAVLCCVALPVFAYPDYNSVQECQKAVNDLEFEAMNKNNMELVSWFESFRKDDQLTFSYQGVNSVATFSGGCSAVTYKNDDGDGYTRWYKMLYKLNEQVQRLKAGKGSLYGNQAGYVCYFPKGGKFTRDNCN